ncbi:MAG: hypothetical protein MUF75_01615 [Bacteroidia bacterium]|jgi:hypothetical protein|nr:hypothetical protein [Bacteroidia bacterium]
MKSFFLHLLFTGLLGLAVACHAPIEKDKVDESTLIAKIDTETLSKAEFYQLFKSVYAGKDSVTIAKRIIDAWAGETLVFLDATQNLGEAQQSITKQVEDYRKNLMNHLYFSKIIEENLDTAISEDEIVEYYTVHSDNFILKDNIVKVDYIKVPMQAPDLEKIKKLLKSQNSKDKPLLVELCSKNAENFFLNDSTWLYTSDVRKEIPKLTDEPDFSLFTGKTVVFEDENYLYYLKIKDIKIKNGLSPLNFERNNIKKYILLNRKTLLLNSFKQNLLEEAKATKKLKLF